MAKLTPEQLEKAHRNLKEGARQRVAERGILQFRADPETILAVMNAAEEQKTTVGALLRQWVQERVTVRKAPSLIERVEALEEKIANLPVAPKKKAK